MSDHILVERADGVMKVVMNRPDKKNALTEAMYAAMGDAIEAAHAEQDVRVIYFTGADGAFTAGNDLGDFARQGAEPAGASQEERPVSRFLRLISTAEKPIVAGVNGLAVGVGVTMLLHCDLVYAGSTASFQMPFVNLGLVPEAASTYLLPKVAGLQKASDLFLTGRKVGAEEAESMGLVAQVFPGDTLQEEAYGRARILASKAPTAVKLTKSLLRGGEAANVASQMAKEAGHFAAQLRSDEVKEAISAFFDKRPADFSKFG